MVHSLVSRFSEQWLPTAEVLVCRDGAFLFFRNILLSAHLAKEDPLEGSYQPARHPTLALTNAAEPLLLLERIDSLGQVAKRL